MYRKVNSIIMETEPEVCLLQIGTNKGIRKHEYRILEVILREFTQLYNKKVIKPIDPDSLTSEERRKSLRTITLIIEKRCCKLKGRICVYGRKKHAYISKEESSPPTISTEALITSLVVDVHEGRDVTTCDIVGAYLNVDMDKFTTMKLEGEMVDMMVRGRT